MGREPTEMELRVAKAVEPLTFAFGPEQLKEAALIRARIAIQAMREPTDEMVDALPDHAALGNEDDVWYAYIDAASPPIEEK